MGTTFTVKSVYNSASNSMSFVNKANSADDFNLSGNTSKPALSVLVPACTSAVGFESNHIEITVSGSATISIWANGNAIYYSYNGWNNTQVMTLNGRARSGVNNNISLTVSVGAGGSWVVGDIEVGGDED